MSNELPISTPGSTGCVEWHTLRVEAGPYGDLTQAMNTPAGAVVRVTIITTRDANVSSVLLPGTSVAQRWTAEVAEADDDLPRRVWLVREIALVASSDVGVHERPVIRIDLDQCEFVSIAATGMPLRPSTRLDLHRAMAENMTIDDALRRALAVVWGTQTPMTIMVVNAGESGRSTVEADIGASPPAPTWVSADDDLPRPSDAEIRAMAGVDVDAGSEFPDGWSWLSGDQTVAVGPEGQRLWITHKPRRDAPPHVEFADDGSDAPIAVVEAVIAQWRKMSDR